MNRLQLLIVDDEPLIRTGIRDDLSAMESVHVAGECGSRAEAVEAIRSNKFDLVLLDVQMPDGTGFDVIREVGAEHMPPVVFVTAYNKYALRAFEVNAVDYLLKPFDDIRLRDSIDRVRERLLRPTEGMHQMDALVKVHNRLLATFDEQTEQVRRAHAELQNAGTVQQNLFPRKASLVAGMEYAARCAPASNVSGDYYDFLDLGSGRLGVVLADVSGKGIPAALLMANLQGCFRSHILSGPPGACCPAAIDQSPALRIDLGRDLRHRIFWRVRFDDAQAALCQLWPPAALRATCRQREPGSPRTHRDRARHLSSMARRRRCSASGYRRHVVSVHRRSDRSRIGNWRGLRRRAPCRRAHIGRDGEPRGDDRKGDRSRTGCGIARLSVESSGSVVTHFTRLSSS